MSAPAEWAPAFPGQRPPFLPGNQARLTHGYWSPRKVNPLAQELIDSVLSDPDVEYLQRPQFRPALFGWARAEARVQLLEEWLGEGVGDLADEQVRTAYQLLDRAEARAASGRAALGLTPLAKARLGRDVAAARVDIAQLLTEAREGADGVGQQPG